MIVATAPEPTVLPPSRIAKRRPCSIATLWISSTVISTLSPGMHISVPAGSSHKENIGHVSGGVHKGEIKGKGQRL